MEEREREKGGGGKKEKGKERICMKVCVYVTFRLVLYGLVLQGSGLQAGASVGQRGGEEGRRPPQALSKTVTAAQKDTETPPSYDRPTKVNESDFICTGQVRNKGNIMTVKVKG